MTSSDVRAPRNPPRRKALRIIILLLVYGGLLALGHWSGDWLIEYVGMDISEEGGSEGQNMLAVALGIYALLMALPFVPGIEISLALLAAFGKNVAVFVYAATVGALVISYVIGRLVPVRLITVFFRLLGQRRAARLMKRLAPMSPDQRLATLIEKAPKRVIPALLRHRYVAVAVALNLPGNAIIGGGGGIALLAGMSGLFTFPRYVVVVALAVLPIPLAIMLM